MVTIPNNMTWHMLSVFMAGTQLEKIVFLFRNFHSHVGWWLHGVATVHCKYLNWTMDMCVVLTFNFNGDLDFLTVSGKFNLDKLVWHISLKVFYLNPICHMKSNLIPCMLKSTRLSGTRFMAKQNWGFQVHVCELTSVLCVV